MKNFILSILLVFFISCKENNSNTELDFDSGYHPYGYIEGVFPDMTGERARELIFVLNGDTLSSRKVTFVSRGREKPQGILTFENVINGEAKTELVVDLSETQNPENEMMKLLFEGVYTMKSQTFNYSGFIEPFLLLLNLEEK